MPLRTRLFIALLVLALVPTLAFAWFTFVQLHAATTRWYQSGVDDALRAAIETNRTTLTRLEATSVERAEAWAKRLPALDTDAKQREAARAGLLEAGLDFVQVYERDSLGWHLMSTLRPDGAPPADTVDMASELPAALTGDHLVRSPSGVLGGVTALRSDAALLVGVMLNPAYWEQLNQVREARDYYARLGVLVEVARQRVWLTIVGMALIILIGAAILARALSSGMTSPLRDLSQALAQVEDGARHEPLPERGAPELASLASSFNAMTARLADARAALAHAEREAAWRDVARKLAHELKNPLTPMSLSIHRLQRRLERVPESDRAAVRESLEAMAQELDHLTRLAESFAQYARMPEPREESLELSQLARAAASLHETPRVNIEVRADATLGVRGDRLLLTRALHNLLVNACEASPDGALVELETGREGPDVWVEVRDRGTGLDPKVAERVFEPYVSTKNRGSGLGLSLVRDIAKQHRGHVSLTNRDGGGAVARLTLPAAPAA